MEKKRFLFPLMIVLVGFLSYSTVSCGDKDDDESKPVVKPDDKSSEKNDSTKEGDKPDTPAVTKAAEGWPSEYGGVMLQAFFWDSYAQTKWSVLTAQADEMSEYFDLLWIPNSSMTSDYYYNKRQTMGYDPCFWLDHNSCFGTEAELRQMIKTFRSKGTGIIEDVVVNHKNGLTTWVDFPDEEREGTATAHYSIKWDNVNYSAICENDECNNSANLSKWSSSGKKTTGARDTGDNFDGFRDLDHTNVQVQQNVTTYLQFLLGELGYVGFRYDMVKGFAPAYVGQYNAASQPSFSVGECWDGNVSVITDWLNGTRKDGVIQSAAFDFPMKYKINSAFQNGQWSALRERMLTTSTGYQRYSVTFVDNHDTGKNPANSSDGPLAKNVEAANAYIMAMPGTPCVWLKHWQSYKGTIKRLIAARHAAGINNESTINTSASFPSGYVLCTQGTKGSVLLVMGNATTETADFQLAVEGTNFKYYVSNGVDLSAVKAVTDTDSQ